MKELNPFRKSKLDDNDDDVEKVCMTYKFERQIVIFNVYCSSFDKK